MQLKLKTFSFRIILSDQKWTTWGETEQEFRGNLHIWSMTRMGQPFQRFRPSFQETTSIFGKDGTVQTDYFDRHIPIRWLIIKRSKYF